MLPINNRKIKEVFFGNIKEEVTSIELDFDDLKKYKFNSNKNYRIIMTVLLNNKNTLSFL